MSLFYNALTWFALNCSNLEQDVKRLEANIQKQVQRTSESTIAMSSSTDGDTCRICNKVKFAGSSGYTCHYCQLKSCSRCGSKLILKAKVAIITVV